VVSDVLGMTGAASTVFAAGLAFVMAMLLYMSVKMSRLGEENHVLTRELALLRYEIERTRRPGSASEVA
jgi:hypothetical protein